MINNLQNSAFFSAFSPYMTRCPNVFQYQHSSSGEWYGVISIPNPYPILAIEMKVEMYITGTVSLVIHLDTFSILECNALSFKIILVKLINYRCYKGRTICCLSKKQQLHMLPAQHSLPWLCMSISH
jgi:hypothetical protein